MSAGITQAQMRKIWAMARELRLNGDLLHAVVAQQTKRESLKDLTANEARKVIDHLVRLSGGSEESRTVVVPVGDGSQGIEVPMATKKQLWYINRLVKDLGWDRMPERLRGFLRKYAKCDDVRWLTRDQAWRVTEGLKRMSREAREARKRAEAQ